MENQIPMMSETIGKLTDALSKFQGSIVQPKLNKNVTVTIKNGGGKYNFKYADLGACISAAAPALKENGLAVIQTIQGQQLVTTLSHTSGEFINSFVPLNQQTLFSTSYQSIGSMITYLKRYAYCAILGIVADDDDDANAACGNQVQYNTTGVHPQQAQAQQAPATQQPVQQAPQSPRAGVTGAQLKGYINDINSKTNIEEMLDAAKQVPVAIKNNNTFKDAVFQKASALGIAELEKCDTTDEISILVDRWNDIWPKVLADKTPFGNAIATKYNQLNA